MADTIEAFVAKLKTEGVEAGQEEAQRLQTEAQAQADQIVSEAEEKAKKIVADAEAERESILARVETELRLASRDTVLKLRERLSQILQRVLNEGARQKITDVDFVGQVLHEIILKYAEADAEHKSDITINVPVDMRDKLVDWAIQEIGQERTDHLSKTIDLKGTLSRAGFEYNATGATVEVTLDSVVESLFTIVGPKLREILADVEEEQGGEDTKPSKEDSQES
ncbi:MAG: hypothetical protein ACLFVU_01510 [Phycisphaerae bacterium]